jgi:DNA-directed RNA polymerase specialized sigma24 family protein
VLIAALDSLPEDYCAIVQLRDVEGLSPQEVSQITG